MLERLPDELIRRIAELLCESQSYASLRRCSKQFAAALPTQGYCTVHGKWGYRLTELTPASVRVMHTCARPHAVALSIDCSLDSHIKGVSVRRGGARYTMSPDQNSVRVESHGVERAFEYRWVMEIDRTWATVRQQRVTHTPLGIPSCVIS